MATISFPSDLTSSSCVPVVPSHSKSVGVDSSEIRLNKLLDEYKTKPRPSTKENIRWVQHIREQLGSEQLVHRWFQKLHEDMSGFHDNDRVAARKHDGDALWLKERILHADWKCGNSDWRRLGMMLGHPGVQASAPGFALGHFQGFQLALRINNRILHPRETDPSTCARLSVVTMNSPDVLGMQYTNTKASKSKTMLIAQLDRSLPADEREWSNTQYVLALEVDDNGRAASFVVIYDLTYRDETDGKGRSLTVDTESEGPRLCGEWFKFTVARVSNPDFGALKPSWGVQEEVDLKLEILSDTTTQLVETGIKDTTWTEGALPIGLYPVSNPTTLSFLKNIKSKILKS